MIFSWRGVPLQEVMVTVKKKKPVDATAAEQGSGRYTENCLIKGWVDRELFKVTAYTGFLSMTKKNS